MKVIVNDKDMPKGKRLKKSSAMNESIDYDEDDDSIGKVGGKYDFVMMVSDGEVYGFVGERIDFRPIGDLKKPIGFQWKQALNREVDFNWLPLDDEYDDGKEHWVPFEDMLGEYDDEDEYDDGECDIGDWE